MAKLRALCTIPMDSGLPEDAVTNTWYFDGAGAFSAGEMSDEIVARLTTFYQAIDSDIFPAIVASPIHVKTYNMNDVEPRAPVDEYDIAIVPGGGTPFPSEVAICLSFEGVHASGQPQARRRGRVFIGPIDSVSLTVVGGKGLVHPSVTDRIADAAEVLMNSADEEAAWAVYSPTEAGATPTLDSAWNDVKRIWVDNAFDTIRSRGVAATLKDARVAS